MLHAKGGILYSIHGRKWYCPQAFLPHACIGHVCPSNVRQSRNDYRALPPAKETHCVRAEAAGRKSYKTVETKMKRFEERTVVITGASRGIGKGIAKRFADEGANLVLAANEAGVDAVAEEFRASGANAVSYVCDVTNKSEVERLYDHAIAKFGKIDVSIQNAGVITIARIEELPEQDWDKIMAVNTKGVFLCCQAAAVRMKPRKFGRIINTASGQARQGFIYTPHYAASKFGVIGITQSLAKELAPDNITVNAFCPGIIETDMWAYNDAAWGKLLGNYKPGELMQEWVQNIPMKRAGKAEDVAGLVSFLASDDAAYITGQTINVDGGLIMS
jgi:meso-butanediol dehydrogenase/(S,S)-butanediol dehydrogenase/diacetyl reductase